MAIRRWVPALFVLAVAWLAAPRAGAVSITRPYGNALSSVVSVYSVDSNGTSSSSSSYAVFGVATGTARTSGTATAEARGAIESLPASTGGSAAVVTTTILAPWQSSSNPLTRIFYALGSSSSPGDSWAADISLGTGFQRFGTFLGPWTLTLAPDAGEASGRPHRLDIDFSLRGALSGEGSGHAAASWFLSTDLGVISDGSAALPGGGLAPFSVHDGVSLFLDSGESFELTLSMNLEASGTGVSSYRSEILESRLSMTATPIPEPGTALLLGLTLCGLGARRRIATLQRRHVHLDVHLRRDSE